jgi:hypothetical protein
VNNGASSSLRALSRISSVRMTAFRSTDRQAALRCS